MLQGALVDVGVPLAALQRAVDALLPGAVSLRASTVHRAGLRAVKVEVEAADDEQPRRTWVDVRGLLARAPLAPRVQELALRTFERLAGAQARVNGVRPEEVHFHEVGALDAIADVVATCAGVTALGVGASSSPPSRSARGRCGPRTASCPSRGPRCWSSPGAGTSPPPRRRPG